MLSVRHPLTTLSCEAGKEVLTRMRPDSGVPGSAVPSPAASRAVMSPGDIARACAASPTRSSRPNRGADDLVVLGIPTRGVALAQRLAAAHRARSRAGQSRSAPSTSPCTATTCGASRPAPRCRTDIPAGGIDDKVVVLVDDVLYSGRTVRAALDALGDLGRPARRPARGAGRPRPPRAADPRRPRRQEPADRAHASASGSGSTRSTASTTSHASPRRPR